VGPSLGFNALRTIEQGDHALLEWRTASSGWQHEKNLDLQIAVLQS